MKLFIKQNLFFLVLSISTFAIFCSLLFLSFSYSDNTTDLLSKSESLFSEYNELITARDSLSHSENDYNTGLADLERISTKEKNLSNFLLYLLNENENLSSKWDSKSAESVNASLTRLFSRLRKKCSESNISLPSEDLQNSSTSPFSINPGNSANDSFGFSFSSYDGNWPSFSVEEARKIGVQSEIVKEIVNTLSFCTDENHTIQILSILREEVGEVDKLNISTDRIDLPEISSSFMRDVPGIDSFVFKVSLQIQTLSLRKFVNGLRPPFQIREISIQPIENIELSPATNTPFTPDPFNTQDTVNDRYIPIVSKVDSKVDLILEYITGAERNLGEIAEKVVSHPYLNTEIYFKWLTSSGNQDSISDTESFFNESINRKTVR